MLELKDLTVRYGQHLALESVSLNLRKGETVVILGANGAGKSTLLKSISGMVPSDAGSEVTLNGRSLVGQPAHEVTEMGIALVPEGRGIFGAMTVDENLRLGANPLRARADEKDRKDFVFELFPKLKERARQYANTMSGGEQQMVAVGRALMSNPDYLMLDEPSLGLAPIVVSALFKSLEKIQTTGVGLLIVEQNVKLSLAIADRGYLLEAGRITGQGSAQELLHDSSVQQAYLGAIKN